MTNEMMKVLELVEEMQEEEKKTVNVPHYYKRNGKLLRRSYDDTVYTERYKELFYGQEIRSKKIFKCCECGCMKDYFSLESWQCDFEAGSFVCHDCYEEEMGEDL